MRGNARRSSYSGYMNDPQRSTPQPFDDGPRSDIDPHLLPASGRPPRVYQAAHDDTIDADEFIEDEQSLASDTQADEPSPAGADGADAHPAHAHPAHALTAEDSQADTDQTAGAASNDGATDVTEASAATDGTATGQGTSERSRLDEAVERSRTIPYAAPVPPATQDDATAEHATEPERNDTLEWDAKAAEANAANEGAETSQLPESETDDADRWKTPEDAQLEEERRRDDAAFESAMLGTTSTEGLIMAPHKRGNRIFALIMAVITTIVFAAVYALVFAAMRFIFTPDANILGDAWAFAGTAAFYVPVAFFAVIMIVWSVLSNRAGWWSYVLVSLLIAIVAFIGHYVGIAGQGLFGGGAWSNQALIDAIRAPENLPGALIAFITARETANWLGGLIAARGRRLTRLNKRDQDEYDARVAEERELSSTSNPVPFEAKQP